VPRASSLLLSVVFFLSGASALVFETLWFRQAGLAFGTSVWASALVLSSFMAGMGLGNGLAVRYGARIRRPLWVYASLEVWIGGVGFALVVGLPSLGPVLAGLLAPLADSAALLRATRFALAFGLLMGPAIAMGATLPLLLKSLFEEGDDFGRLLGRLYGINTLGAVVGAVGSEVLLVPLTGVAGSGAIAAGMNLLAAGLAFAVARGASVRRHEFASGTGRPVGFVALRLLFASFLSGLAVLALEVVWFRLVILFVPQTSAVFSWMLGVVLAGIALGGLLGAGILRFAPAAHAFTAGVGLLCGVATVAAYRLFPLVATRFANPSQESLASILPIALVLMLPTSLLSGVLFTWIGKQLHAELASDVRATGLLALANTAGAALGPLLASFVLLPTLGVERSLWLLALTYLGVGICGFSRSELGSRTGRLVHVGALVLFALALVRFPWGLMPALYTWFLDRSVGQQEQLVAFREGVIQTIGITRKTFQGEPYYYRLVTDGYSMSGTPLGSQRYMSLFAHLPRALHPDPRDALLISYGVGITAGALTDIDSLERIDVVDISSDILEMSETITGEDDPLDDPRVHVHIEDGRYFLQATPRRYDIITGEPPPPAAAGVVNLYTVEYFELLRSRLREGGLVSYWLPVSQLTEEDSKRIVAAFCRAFTDCTLWEGSPTNWILLGSNGARPVDEESFARLWQSNSREQLIGIGLERPEHLAALFLADESFLASWSSDALPLVDDWPQRAPAWAPGHWKGGMPDEYAAIANERAARRAFERSPFIDRVLPDAVRQRALESFDTLQQQRWVLLHPGNLRFDALHEVLTETDLETLPLWMMGSDADKQRIAAQRRSAGEVSSRVDYELGVAALARRDYAEAADRFERVRASDFEEPRLAMRGLLYAVYARAMAGDPEGAARLAARIQPLDAPDRVMLARFLEERFGIDGLL